MGIFIGPTLPRTPWVTEIDLYVRRQRKALMSGHLGTSIPGQRFVEFLWQFARILDQRIGERPGIFTGDLYPHQVACLTFDESCNLTAAISAQ